MVAKEVFKSESGLTDDQIIYLGHSLGARVALQAAVMDPSPPAALVLLGTQVNLGTNLQSEFFTGTNDTDLAWVQSLSASVPASQVFLFSGSWDDILTPSAAQTLFDKLGGETAPNRTLTLIPGLLHNYEIYSARLFQQAAIELEEQDWLSFPSSPSLSGYYLFCALTLIGLFGSLILAPRFLKQWFPSPPPTPLSVTIGRLHKFMWAKLYLWVAAVPIAGLLSGLFFLLPLHLPVFNLIYVGFIGGYGLLFFGLYLWGKVPGTRGKWHLREHTAPTRISLSDTRFWLGLLLWAVMLVIVVLFTRSGLFYVIAPNQRLIWLAIFTPITALGFWIGAREAQMVEVFKHQSGKRLPWATRLLSLVSLTPFFIYTLFMGILGSVSGVVGGVQGLLILAIVLLTGKSLQYFIRKPFLVAILQAALLYALILPQGVLFAF